MMKDLFKANNKALSDKFIPRNEVRLETSKVYNSAFDLLIELDSYKIDKLLGL